MLKRSLSSSTSLPGSADAAALPLVVLQREFAGGALQAWRDNVCHQEDVDADVNGRALRWENLPEYQSHESVPGNIPVNRTQGFMRRMPYPPLKPQLGVDEVMDRFKTFVEQVAEKAGRPCFSSQIFQLLLGFRTSLRTALFSTEPMLPSFKALRATVCNRQQLRGVDFSKSLWAGRYGGRKICRLRTVGPSSSIWAWFLVNIQLIGL